MRLYVLNETWVVGCNFGKPTRCWSNLDYHRMFLMLQQVVWLLKHLKPSNRIEKSNRMLCNCVVARLVMYCTSHFGNHPDSIITICSRKLVKFRHETPSMWNTAAICSHQSIPSPVALVDQLSTLASCEHFRQFARSLDQIFWTFGSVQNWGDEALSSTSQSKENRHYMDVYLKIIWKKHEKKHSHRSSSSCSHSVILHGSHVPLTSLDQQALFWATSWPTTCQVAIEVKVWDAGVEIIDGQCCRGGLFREAWCFPSRHGGTYWNPWRKPGVIYLMAVIYIIHFHKIISRNKST